MSRTVRIGVDVGGTFTDLLLHDPARDLTWPGKLPTTPHAPQEAIIAGVARLLAETDTPAGDVAGVVHGTTLVTNTLLERTGAVVGLLTTNGFRDVLEMAREIRFDTTDLLARRPARWCPGTCAGACRAAWPPTAPSSSRWPRTTCWRRPRTCWNRASRRWR